jgi:sec-independent protein translocase protein TatA
MGNLGCPELVIILVIALLVFGPGKMPEIGRSLGKGIAEFKNAFAKGEAASEEKESSRPESSPNDKSSHNNRTKIAARAVNATWAR